MVSRVSAPARSIGLLRLQRGGSFSSIAARRSSGRARSSSSERVIASAVTTPQPPAVVSTATRGPRGSGWVAKVAAASNASSTLAVRGDRGLAAHAVEHPVVAGERARVRRGGPLTARRRTALQQHQRLHSRDRARPLVEGAPVADTLDVGERDGRLGIGGVVLEEVGDGDRGGVARGDRPAHPDAARDREVLERRHEVPGLARDADPARRWERGDDLRAQARGRGHDSLPVRPGEQDAELASQLDELALGARRRPRRLRRIRRR